MTRFSIQDKSILVYQCIVYDLKKRTIEPTSAAPTNSAGDYSFGTEVWYMESEPKKLNTCPSFLVTRNLSESGKLFHFPSINFSRFPANCRCENVSNFHIHITHQLQQLLEMVMI
jgi:hypothetical protein